ncbi:DUF4166 domain-containing protein [Bacillus sp. NPDC077027]|uniref:DUF4166 domain-containing protein n=1 Tax=Bacillus sp. NPDC077027 TaxID=3390548 RepID=UPI003D00A9E7
MVIHHKQVYKYDKLHPMLKRRYNRAFIGEGVMEEISGGSRFIRFLFRIGPRFRCFFPERGRQIPFRIVNQSFISRNNEVGMHWYRTFYFPQKTRHFDADMIVEDDSGTVLDYFGKPNILVSELYFSVTKDGSLRIQSGKQKFMIFGQAWSLPSFLYGVSDVIEGYDEERDEYTIHVQVNHRLFGTLFTYKGRFTEKVNEDE